MSIGEIALFQHFFLILPRGIFVSSDNKGYLAGGFWGIIHKKGEIEKIVARIPGAWYDLEKSAAGGICPLAANGGEKH